MKKILNFEVRTNLLYDPKEHFWLDIKGNIARIGMSSLVQETTGSFVAVQFEESGKRLTKSSSFGSIEAEKHVGHLKAPISGVILKTNAKVMENPRLINTDPYGEGWLVEIEMSHFEEEIKNLIQGEENIIAWFESELKKYDEKGWLAQP